MTADQSHQHYDSHAQNVGWTERLMARDDIRLMIATGRFDLSIESIIRMCEKVDASEHIEISEESLAASIWHLAGDDVPPDFKSWALAVIAKAVAKQEGSYKLVLKQQSTGRPPPQKSDVLDRMIDRFNIARSAEQFEAAGVNGPNKAAAREHGCDLEEVKRARAETRDLRALAEKSGNKQGQQFD
jgi:hypothetical protein